MKPLLNLDKEYSLVLAGGGARGAYQVGAWKALKEAGVKINAVAGTSVGALNGALICMEDIERAERIWHEMTFSKVMNVDDAWAEKLFHGEQGFKEVLHELRNAIANRGVDITPLKKLIRENMNEEKMRASKVAFYLITFSLSEFKKMDLGKEDIPHGLMEDFLLASAYLPGFKNEKLHGKRYIDGSVVNNVPIESLVRRGYTDIIAIRITGFGREPRVKMPEGSTLYEIDPRVDLGSAIEFDGKRSRHNMKIGYYDAKRMLYGLEGFIYYIKPEHNDSWYRDKFHGFSEREKTSIAFLLKLSRDHTEKELYLAMLEASAKQLRVPKYHIYSVEELYQQTKERYHEMVTEIHLPRFTHILFSMGMEEELTMRGRDFLTLKDYTPTEIHHLLNLSAELKEMKKQGVPVDYYRGKNIALIFEKTSTRTRCAFEVAAHDLGMGTTYLDSASSQIGSKESIADTARVLGRMYDGIQYRGFGQEIVEELACYAGVPVWNGLTNEDHPTQMLADLLTIQEQFGRLQGIRLVYMGDARYNMGNALMIACAKMGMHFVACTDKKYFPDQELVALCEEYAKESGGTITLTEDVETGVLGADVVYTDVWVSMGEPMEVWEERIRELAPYKVTKEVMALAGEESIFLHCLPAFHDLKTTIGKEMGERFRIQDMEVTDEVFEAEYSKVFDQSENRMHTIKAVMVATLGEF